MAYRPLRIRNGGVWDIVGDPRLTPTIAGLSAVYQPLDSDLTAIAALSTTAYGRSLLTLADAAALRTAGGLVIGTDVQAYSAVLATIVGLSPVADDVLQFKAGAWANRTLAQLMTDLAALGTTFQPLDSDLTAIAALSTTTYGRSLLALADAAALRTTAGLVIGTNVQAWDTDLDAIAALGVTNDSIIQGKAGVWAKRTIAQLLVDLAAPGTTFQPLDATLTAFAALTIAANTLTIGTGADAFSQTTFAANTFPARASTGNLVAKAITDFGLSLLDDADAGTARTTLGAAALASPTFTGTPAAPTAAAGTNTTQLATTAFVQQELASYLPPGSMVDYAGTSVPSGWLACDGSAVSRTTYAALFTAISTTWGAGNGTTTFNVPDFRRRVAVGSGGSGTATLGNATGNTGGSETHTLSTSEMPAHTHPPATNYEAIWMRDANATLGVRSFDTVTLGNLDNAPTVTGSTGGGSSHNNIQPSAVVTKIIKT